MGLISEFKDFIVKGNAIDLAVGIIIGAAFGGLVKSLVDDVMMPPIGALLGGVDFSSLAVTIQGPKKSGETLINGMTASKDMPAVVLAYGKFINALIALIIQGFCIFLVVKAINKMKRSPAPAPVGPPPPTPEDIVLLREIRDSLKK